MQRERERFDLPKYWLTVQWQHRTRLSVHSHPTHNIAILDTVHVQKECVTLLVVCQEAFNYGENAHLSLFTTLSKCLQGLSCVCNYHNTVGRVLIARFLWLQIASFSDPRNQKIHKVSSNLLLSWGTGSTIAIIRIAISLDEPNSQSKPVLWYYVHVHACT